MTDATMRKLTKIVEYFVAVQQDCAAKRLVGVMDQSAIDALRNAPELVRQATSRAEKLLLRIVGDYVRAVGPEQLERDLGINVPAGTPEVPANDASTTLPATPINVLEPAPATEVVTAPVTAPAVTRQPNVKVHESPAARQAAYRKRKQEKALEAPPAALASSQDEPKARPVPEPPVSVETPQNAPVEVVQPEASTMSVQAFLDLPEAPASTFQALAAKFEADEPGRRSTNQAPPPSPSPVADQEPPQLEQDAVPAQQRRQIEIPGLSATTQW
jgi:hypothetical protein